MGVSITQDHKYYNDSGIQYQGVTSLVSLYRPPFDAVAISQNHARKHGETPEHWQKVWSENADAACDRGHEFHAFKEEQLMGRGVDVIQRAVRMVRNQHLYPEARQSLYSLPDGLYVELQLWDDGYRLAGTSDKNNIDTIGTIRYVDIDDHKTNGKITTRGYEFRDGSHKMMLPPIAHLEDCKLTHYELQISFYAFIFERHGFTPRNITFTHYPPTEGESDVTKRTDGIVYQLKYRKKEVINILKHHIAHENSRRRRGSVPK